MYFTEPGKILDIFVEIEENNLFLIQNCQVRLRQNTPHPYALLLPHPPPSPCLVPQETEQALEEIRAKYEDAKVKMDKQVAQLKSQIEIEKQKISAEEMKKKTLQARTQRSDAARGQEAVLKLIEHKVSAIYKQWLGEDHQSQSTLGIMTLIETKLEELKAWHSNTHAHTPRCHGERADDVFLFLSFYFYFFYHTLFCTQQKYIDENVPGGRDLPGDMVSQLMKQQYTPPPPPTNFLPPPTLSPTLPSHAERASLGHATHNPSTLVLHSAHLSTAQGQAAS